MKTIILKSFNIRHKNFSISGTSNDLFLQGWHSETITGKQFNDFDHKDLKTLIEFADQNFRSLRKRTHN